jgi:hypothetical protein
MTDNERATMLRYVKGDFENATWKDGEAEYLEWGSGGSTSTYGTVAKRAYSVEHAVAWCDIITEWLEMRCMRESNRWQLFCHDPQMELAKWGYPNDRKSVGYHRFQVRGAAGGGVYGESVRVRWRMIISQSKKP